MSILLKFEARRLSRSEASNIGGGASEARCNRMFDRWARRGFERGTRFEARLDKNCGNPFNPPVTPANG